MNVNEEIPIFVASSVREFEDERIRLADYLDAINQAHEEDGVRVVWHRPETMSRALYVGGSQRPYDDKIRECRFFVLLIGRTLGAHTEAEFNLALERFKETGTPLIIPFFLNVRADENVLKFERRLREELDIGEQYTLTYGGLDSIVLQLHIELIRRGAFRRGNAEASDKEETAQKGQDAARRLVREQRDKIAQLEAQPVSPQVIAEMTDTYEEIRRLVQTYKVEPDALIAYLDFLWKQHLYDTAIQIGGWLENFYKLENPGDRAWAILKNRMVVCYWKSHRYEKAERYFQDALHIWRILKDEHWTAVVCDNLALVLSDTNRNMEAERYYEYALEIRRRFAKANPAVFEPDLAKTCHDLAYLLSDTTRRDEAERYGKEALEIRRRFVKINPASFEPDLAMTCNNLGYLFIVANKMDVAVSPEKIKKAEPYLQEALEIKRRYAVENPKAYKPTMAVSLYNLGVLEYKRNQPNTARLYFEESLAIFEEFPHCADRAQQCRDALAKL